MREVLGPHYEQGEEEGEESCPYTPCMAYVSFSTREYIIGRPKALPIQRSHRPLSACWRLFSTQTSQVRMIISSSWPPCVWPMSETESSWKVKSWIWGWAAKHFQTQCPDRMELPVHLTGRWNPRDKEGEKILGTFHQTLWRD